MVLLAPTASAHPGGLDTWQEYRQAKLEVVKPVLKDGALSVTKAQVLADYYEGLESLRREWGAFDAKYWHEVEQAQVVETPVPSAPLVDTSAPTPSGDIYDALAQCESGMTNANTGNGYYGYFQFLPSTWSSLGYSGMPTDHSYATQKQGAIALIARSGWGQFPGCAAKLGML